jgi:hypothetical protein
MSKIGKSMGYKDIEHWSNWFNLQKQRKSILLFKDEGQKIFANNKTCKTTSM